MIIFDKFNFNKITYWFKLRQLKKKALLYDLNSVGKQNLALTNFSYFMIDILLYNKKQINSLSLEKNQNLHPIKENLNIILRKKIDHDREFIDWSKNLFSNPKSFSISKIIRYFIVRENLNEDILNYMECHPKDETFEIFFPFFQSNSIYFSFKEKENYNKYKTLVKENASRMNEVNLGNALMLEEINHRMNIRNFYDLVEIYKFFYNKDEIYKLFNESIIKLVTSNQQKKNILFSIENGLSLINFAYLNLNSYSTYDDKIIWDLIKKNYLKLIDDLSLVEILIMNSLFCIKGIEERDFQLNILNKLIEKIIKEMLEENFTKKIKECHSNDIVANIFSFYIFALKICYEIQDENLILLSKKFISSVNQNRQNNIYDILLLLDNNLKGINEKQKIISTISDIEVIYYFIQSAKMNTEYLTNLDLYLLNCLSNNQEANSLNNLVLENLVKTINQYNQSVNLLKNKELLTEADSYILQTAKLKIKDLILKIWKILNRSKEEVLISVRNKFLVKSTKTITDNFLNKNEFSNISEIHEIILEISPEYKQAYLDWQDWQKFFEDNQEGSNL
jgi:hypothetical protein